MGGESGQPRIEVRRSSRRKRTVSAYLSGDTLVVLLPAHLSDAEAADWVERMRLRTARRRTAGQAPTSDVGLYDRAQSLSARYLARAARPTSVRWVSNQHMRWASATPQTGSIRLSEQLRGMPGWVVDYVLVHELAHLLVAGHGPDFWRLVAAYPKTERARGYLEGVVAARALGRSQTPAGQSDPGVTLSGGIPARQADADGDGWFSPALPLWDPLDDG